MNSKMENIWNHKAGYSFFRPYVEWIARNSIAGFIHLPRYLALALIAATVCAPRTFYRILMFYNRLRESNNQ